MLIVVQILLNRMVPGKKGNYWASNLQAIINAKMVKKVKTKGEAV